MLDTTPCPQLCLQITARKLFRNPTKKSRSNGYRRFSPNSDFAVAPIGEGAASSKRFSCVQVLAGDGWAVRDQRARPRGCGTVPPARLIDGPMNHSATGGRTRRTYPGCSRRIDRRLRDVGCERIKPALAASQRHTLHEKHAGNPWGQFAPPARASSKTTSADLALRVEAGRIPTRTGARSRTTRCSTSPAYWGAWSDRQPDRRWSPASSISSPGAGRWPDRSPRRSHGSEVVPAFWWRPHLRRRKSDR